MDMGFEKFFGIYRMCREWDYYHDRPGDDCVFRVGLFIRGFFIGVEWCAEVPYENDPLKQVCIGCNEPVHDGPCR